MTPNNDEGTEPIDATAASIGAWLLRCIEEAAPRHFYQSHAVARIRKDFGEKWSYKNQNGNWAISREILGEFRKLKYPNIQWDKNVQSWQLVTDEKLAQVAERDALAKQRKELAKQLRDQRAQG